MAQVKPKIKISCYISDGAGEPVNYANGIANLTPSSKITNYLDNLATVEDLYTDAGIKVHKRDPEADAPVPVLVTAEQLLAAADGDGELPELKEGEIMCVSVIAVVEEYSEERVRRGLASRRAKPSVGSKGGLF